MNQRYHKTLVRWKAMHDSSQKLICGICGKPIEKREQISIDHIHPKSLGGKNHPYNYQPAHIKCNSKRGNKTLVAPTLERNKLRSTIMANKTVEEILLKLAEGVRVGYAKWERDQDNPNLGEAHEKQLVTEASRQLYEAELERIGEDEPCDGTCDDGIHEALNRRLAELRAKALAFYGITETEQEGE